MTRHDKSSLVFFSAVLVLAAYVEGLEEFLSETSLRVISGDEQPKCNQFESWEMLSDKLQKGLIKVRSEQGPVGCRASRLCRPDARQVFDLPKTPSTFFAGL
jgi:hypothetical protein